MVVYELPLIMCSVILGLIVGSFLNVVAYRVPRGESIAWPGSRCPECGHPIRWYHNVPVVGWAVLRGHCHDCGGRISWRYPLVEVATAAVFLAAAVLYGPEPRVLLVWSFLAVLLAISLIDIDYLIIPDKIVLPMAAAGLVASIALDPSHWWEYVVAGLGAAAFLFVVALIWPGGMGMGDVKMALLMGFVLGRYVIVALFLAFFLGALVSILLIATGRKTRKDKIPFGPFLAAGAALAVLWGPQLLDAYLQFY